MTDPIDPADNCLNFDCRSDIEEMEGHEWITICEKCLIENIRHAIRDQWDQAAKVAKDMGAWASRILKCDCGQTIADRLRENGNGPM